MPRRLLLLLSLLVAAPAAADEPKKAAPNPIVGIWLGTLKVGPIELRVGFHIAADTDGKLSAKFDSLDQGALGLPVETVAFSKNTLTIEMPPFKIGYVGELQADKETIKGDFTQAGKIPLELKRVEKMPSMNRPQHPKKPYPYTETEVTFDSKAAGVKLAGTLTAPPGAGPFPAVVLISGSGPQDRDETLMGHKPFLVLADHLTRHGVAVLRFDDRGVGKSTGEHDKATSADFAEDAAGAVAFLKTRKEIGKVGLMGHSEGGLIAPMVAAKNADVAFIVLLAGPGLSGEEILFTQGKAILKGSGKTDEDVKVAREIQEKLFGMVKKDATAEEVMKAADALMEKLPEKDRKAFREGGGKARLAVLTTPWYRAFIKYDPRPALRQVKCPVLAVVGELDIQVLPKENLAEIEKALKEGKNPDYTVKEFPKLNHLFQTAKTGMVSEYGHIEETFAPVALEAVTEWVLKRGK